MIESLSALCEDLWKLCPWNAGIAVVNTMEIEMQEELEKNSR
jgi:hypothetical protein